MTSIQPVGGIKCCRLRTKMKVKVEDRRPPLTRQRALDMLAGAGFWAMGYERVIEATDTQFYHPLNGTYQKFQ